MANNTGGEYWPFLGPRGLFQQLEAEVPVSAMDSTDSTEQFLLQNTKSSPSMPKDMWWDIKYYLIHPPVIIFVMTSLNAALKQSDQRYEGSVHHFQPTPTLLLFFAQSAAHFLHTCTCDAQGWTLVGRQAQFWFGAAAVNSQWQYT